MPRLNGREDRDLDDDEMHETDRNRFPAGIPTSALNRCGGRSKEEKNWHATSLLNADSAAARTHV